MSPHYPSRFLNACRPGHSLEEERGEVRYGFGWYPGVGFSALAAEDSPLMTSVLRQFDVISRWPRPLESAT